MLAGLIALFFLLVIVTGWSLFATFPLHFVVAAVVLVAALVVLACALIEMAHKLHEGDAV